MKNASVTELRKALAEADAILGLSGKDSLLIHPERITEWIGTTEVHHDEAKPESPQDIIRQAVDSIDADSGGISYHAKGVRKGETVTWVRMGLSTYTSKADCDLAKLPEAFRRAKK